MPVYADDDGLLSTLEPPLWTVAREARQQALVRDLVSACRLPDEIQRFLQGVAAFEIMRVQLDPICPDAREVCGTEDVGLWLVRYWFCVRRGLVHPYPVRVRWTRLLEYLPRAEP